MTSTDDFAEIERLRARLLLAEQVCVLVGWTATGSGKRGDALGQAWQDWVHAYPDAMPNSHDPEWDARIEDLASRRAEIRARTLARLRDDGGAA